jgi:F420-0:gamma-glutamyl ligase
MTVTVAPVTGLPEITAGADLAALIADAAPDLRDGDQRIDCLVGS